MGGAREAQIQLSRLPLDGRPAQRQVGRYTVSFIGFVWDPARIKVLVEGA